MGLLDQLNEVLLQTPRRYWGDKATRLGSLLSDSAATGAQAYGSANSPMAPEHANTLAGLLADFTPVVGDVKSAYDGMNAAREGDYLGAALGGLGALPMVPNLAGAIKPVVSKSGRKMEIYDPENWKEAIYGLKKEFSVRPITDGSRIPEGRLSIWKDKDGYHLNDVQIDPQSRNDGLGSLLMEYALKQSPEGLFGSTGFSEGGARLASKFGLTKKDGKRWIPPQPE